MILPSIWINSPTVFPAVMHLTLSPFFKATPTFIIQSTTNLDSGAITTNPILPYPSILDVHIPYYPNSP
jgi:hypothetical protein